MLHRKPNNAKLLHPLQTKKLGSHFAAYKQYHMNALLSNFCTLVVLCFHCSTETFHLVTKPCNGILLLQRNKNKKLFFFSISVITAYIYNHTASTYI